MDMTVVKSGHILTEEERVTFASCILLYLLQFSSILFLLLQPTAVLLLLLPFCPSSAALPPTLSPFPSMYIFRSRVIKSAPEGMCLNRISLILPCPHHSAKTRICTNTCTSVTKHANTNASLSFSLLHLSLFTMMK